MADQRDKPLSTWAEIAAYLGVSVRTAQAYERLHDLPIRRLPGEKARVYGYPEDLDAWRRQSRLKQQDHEAPASPVEVASVVPTQKRHYPNVIQARWFLYSVISATVVCIGLAGLTKPVKKPSAPAGFEAVANTLIVKDGRGHELFQHEFPHPLVALQGWPYQSIAPRSWVAGDIEGDGQTEVVFAYNPEAHLDEFADRVAELVCFSLDGRIKWRFAPGRPVLTDNTGDQYFPPYWIGALELISGRTKSSDRIVVSSFHNMEAPDQVAVLDGHGRLVGEYWHPGWLRIMGVADLDHDGKPEVLLAGVNNGQHSATLVVFDPDHVRGTATSLSDPRFGFRSLPIGTEKAVVLFPRSCVSRAGPHQRPFNIVCKLTVIQGRLFVEVVEGAGESDSSLTYELDYDLKVRSVSPNLSFQWAHTEMEKAGVLDHSLGPKDIQDLASRVVVRRNY